jgi:hypothetical protein
MSVDLETEVKALREEVHELKHQVVTDFMSHIKEQQKQISSRRGDSGRTGDTGAVGPAGRDMVLIVKTDTENNVIRVFDESGTEKAQIVAVPGPKGDVGPQPAPIVGPAGRDGKNAPSLAEIVRAVLSEVKAKL